MSGEVVQDGSWGVLQGLARVEYLGEEQAMEGEEEYVVRAGAGGEA